MYITQTISILRSSRGTPGKLRLLVLVPLRNSIGGVAKFVGDVAMCVGDHVKVFIFLRFLTQGRSSVLKQHRIVTILQIFCLKMLKD